MDLIFHRKQLVTHPSSADGAVYATPRLMGASFLLRNTSTWGQILLVSVPENVWRTPLHLEGENTATPLVKGILHPQKKPCVRFLMVPVELQDRLCLGFIGLQPPCDRVWRVVFPLDQRLPGDVVQSLQRALLAFSRTAFQGLF